jgi:DNA polymerase I-like protein with 3'-5' exonuclease and polymerase domains
LGKIFQALVIAMRDNEVVCHNALFDLFILAWKYNIPVGHKIYDTMLAHHRLWPEIEKSLGHCMSHLLYEPYHKDQGIYSPATSEQEQRLWKYNANDVRATILIKEEIERIGRSYPGAIDSIRQVNRSIRPDLINTLQGIRYSEQDRQKLFSENDRLMTHYFKMCNRLVGHEMLPSSPKQCVDYFHGELDYKVITRSARTNEPSLDKNNIYKLKLKYPDNPVLDFVLAFRRLSKESGTLKFTPWIKEDDQVTGTTK